MRYSCMENVRYKTIVLVCLFPGTRMTHYLQKAFETYCDATQTSIARETAYAILVNAGFSDNDIQNAAEHGVDSLQVFLFAA